MQEGKSIRYELVPTEPGRFWIRHTPQAWPGPAGWWLDLSRAEPAGSRLREAGTTLAASTRFDDVVYVPPLDSGGELLRQEIVNRCADAGVPVVQQIFPGDSSPVGPGVVVFDLTEDLVRNRLGELPIRGGCWAVWPLIPGLTDREDTLSRGLDFLQAAGVAGILPMSLSLNPVQRRELAAFGSAAAYSEIFHGDRDGSLREISAAIGERGFSLLPLQPPLAKGRRAPNRALAGHFSTLAELWLRCGRPEGRAQVYFRMARRLEAERTDVAELARRSGLGSVEWLDKAVVGEVRDFANGRSSKLRTELEKEILRRDG
jgi:hypothetical protein